MTDPYVYPGTTVLRNTYDIKDAAELREWERDLVTFRIAEGTPSGRFDLSHLCAIHRHLFQDIYPWAGEIRSVEIEKGGKPFLFARFIESGMQDIHRKLERSSFGQGLNRPAFVDFAGGLMSDLNHVHPFREGNGRTQLQYLKQFCDAAGHPLDLTQLDATRWLEASIATHDGDHSLMAAEIDRCLIDPQPKLDVAPDRGIDF